LVVFLWNSLQSDLVFWNIYLFDWERRKNCIIIILKFHKVLFLNNTLPVLPWFLRFGRWILLFDVGYWVQLQVLVKTTCKLWFTSVHYYFSSNSSLKSVFKKHANIHVDVVIMNYMELCSWNDSSFWLQPLFQVHRNPLSSNPHSVN